MPAPTVDTIPVRHCDFEAKVKVAGSGPPLLYLHPAGGPMWDPFVESLAEQFTVYAPDHPGTGRRRARPSTASTPSGTSSSSTTSSSTRSSSRRCLSWARRSAA